MNAMAFIAVVWASVVGMLIVGVLWPRDRDLRGDGPFVLPLGVLLGMAATSVIFFFTSLVFARPGLIAGVVEVVLVVILAFRLSRRERVIWPASQGARVGWLQLVMATVAVQMVL